MSIWISLELMALSSYILAGYFKRETRSNEAALKYFIYGAFASAFALFGIALVYGEVRDRVRQVRAGERYLRLGGDPDR